MTDQAGERLLGTSEALKALAREVECAARSDAKVLITGESGTGKELTAQLIHQKSARRDGPFMAVNCAGVPETLLESELFGHTRGSYTDAYRDRSGLLEAAHRGTIFLDEVGEMSPRMQGLLLRFLDKGEIQRIGAERASATVDARVVAATNRNLMAGIEQKSFREDLFYRLDVIRVAVPSMRERREDIPVLFDWFLAGYSRRYGTEGARTSREAIACLMAYHWPGNVRELRNVAERLAVRSLGHVITPEDLPPEIRLREVASEAPAPRPKDLTDALYSRMVIGRECFWSVVYDPFMLRDITRHEVRQIIGRGLEQTRGSYTSLIQLFNMPPYDYKRFLGFLRKHECHLRFQRFPVPPGGGKGHAPSSFLK